jgi:N-succinyldiaminopimelate aminotransferase
MAGGVPRYVLLRPPDGSHTGWWFEEEELRAAFSQKTRLILVNTPHNPTGKVFTRGELEQVADLCERHDASVLSDEVYEHLVFAPARHLRPATLPRLRDRTVTVSSGGKTFSLTGWKIGWAIGPPELRNAVQQAHQFVTFATASPLQAAVATALRLPDAYFQKLGVEYAERRGLLMEALSQAGFRPFAPEGTYFIVADVSAAGFDDDFAFCRDLTSRAGVAAIPPSAFYSDGHRVHARHLARFAFCKRPETLREAARRLVRK